MLKKLGQALSLLLPVLAAIFSPLTLFAVNIPAIGIEDALRSLLVSAAAALLLLGFLWIIFRDRSLAILVSTAAVILFFSYGHLYQVMKTWKVMGISVGRHRYLLPFLGSMFLGWFVWISRDQSARTSWYMFFQFTLVLLLLLPMYRLLISGVGRVETDDSAGRILETQYIANTEDYPDIYYIILDGYARADVLESRYGIDNSDFLEQLERRGFYIADEAMANYPTTSLSLASSLNMEYLNDLDDEPEVEHNELLQTLHDLFSHSEVRTILEDEGYFTVSYDTGYFLTRIEDADEYLVAPGDSSGLNHYESTLMDTTLMLFITDTFGDRSVREEQTLYPRYEAHRTRIHFILDSLGEIAARPERTFVFAHLVSPHPPFVFDENGERILASQAFTFNDGSDFRGSTAEYIHGYSAQLMHINDLVLAAVEEIVANSEYPPYILLQADHGPGSELVWGAPTEDALYERFGILNAYYFPDGDYESLYPSITPVNSFRVVLNHLLDRHEPMLGDACYYSYPSNLLLMEEVQFLDTAPQ